MTQSAWVKHAAGAALVAFNAYYLAESWRRGQSPLDFDVGAAQIPVITAIIGLVCSLVYWLSVFTHRDRSTVSFHGMGQVAGYLASLAAALLLLQVLPIYLALGLFAALATLVLAGRRHWKLALANGAVWTVAIYGIFGLLFELPVT